MTTRRYAIGALAFVAALATLGPAPALRAEAPVPPPEGLRFTATSDEHGITVRAGPREGAVSIGSFQPWVVELYDAGGQPIYPARIGINGGMPGHGHGLPTQPQVTRYLGEGRYLIEGLKLNMAGDWTLLFGIETPTLRDQARLDFNVDF